MDTTNARKEEFEDNLQFVIKPPSLVSQKENKCGDLATEGDHPSLIRHISSSSDVVNDLLFSHVSEVTQPTFTQHYASPTSPYFFYLIPPIVFATLSDV
uniref:Uncharacterized protein n=1 Tax=Cucumis melo TaxID=3656 RepID=A0A9I9D118_CUCME